MLESRSTAGRLKLLVARALTSRSTSKALTVVHRHRVRSNGLTFDTSAEAFTPQTEAALLLGLYESAEIRFARKHLAGESVVVDLGSSLGVVSSHILDVMDPNGRLVCVEANPALIPTLEATVQEHKKPGQRAEVVHAAVANEPVRLALHGTMGSRRGDNGELVPTMSLSELLDRCQIGEYALSSDIEGAEVDFVVGDPAGLERCHLVVAELEDTEFEGRTVTADEIFDAWVALGYDSVEQHGPVVALARNLPERSA